ncbi:MAG: FG-GAP-like repeat-containing protein, partial [bacterium]
MRYFIFFSVLAVVLFSTGPSFTQNLPDDLTFHNVALDAGFALSFDGQNDYVKIDDSPLLSGGPGKSITVEAWVKPNSVIGRFSIVTKWFSSRNKDWGMRINNGQVLVAIESNGDNWEYVAGGVSAGVWSHVAFTYNDAAERVRIFVNGVEAGTGAARSGMPDTDAAVLIGKNGYKGQPFTGVIEEVRIWDFAKSAAEIQTTMSTTLTGNEPGLIGYWNFDEGSGQTTVDFSGHSSDGTLFGPTWVQSDAPLSGQDFLMVASPNGGESWERGRVHTIQWSASSSVADVTIEFSANGGTSWTTVALLTANDGSFPWTTPDNTTNAGLIRISDAADGDPVDVSDSPFSIVDPQHGELSFTDITVSAGTGGPTGNGRTGGHSATWADVNGDGRPDLFFTMLFRVPMEDLFFRNTGNNHFADEASLRGIADFDSGSHGATFADLDNDGDYDLFNGTTFGTDAISAHNNIFRNDGNGFFTDVTGSTGIPEREWPTRGVLAFDMDKDGDLDLLAITNYQGSDDPAGERNELYRNNGHLNFQAVNSGALYRAPAGQGATDTDYDGDGDIDIFAANRTGDVNILRNNGAGDFTKITPASIGLNHQAGDGITAGDIDNDGDLDLLLTPANSGFLYRNTGGGSFAFVQSFSNTDGYMGGFADLDNDGDLDLVFSGDSKCYLNDGSGNFSVGPAIPVSGIGDPRAVGFADIDDDGDMDFAFGCKRSRNWLVRNNFNAGNWLKVKLISPQGQAGAFGAKTRIYPAGQAGGQQLGLRESRSNNGYLGQNDPVLHFGLGAATIVDVVVQFLDGSVETRTNVPGNQTILIDASGGNGPRLPFILSFSPSSGEAGSTVVILGENFTGATSVLFNSNPASNFSVDSDGQITTTVSANATTGPVTVTTATGTATSSEDFTVTQSSGTVTLPPTEDTFIRSKRPTKNYGHSVELRVRRRNANDLSYTYLKFNITGLSGPPQSARIRLYVTDASNEGGTIYVTANEFHNSTEPWTEETLIWNNAPSISGSPLSSLADVVLNEIVEFNVTPAISGNGLYSFVIKNGAKNTAKYSPKEGPVAPALVLEGTDLPLMPVIQTFSPASGPVGTVVTVSGSHFTGA